MLILGTVEFTFREHRHGYKSHGAVLGAVAGLVVGTALWRLTGLAKQPCLIGALLTFGAVWALLARTFVPQEAREAADEGADPS